MKKRGFTIIELMVVISIITILIGLLVAGGNAARTKARITKAKAQMAALETALTAFEVDFGFYPTDQVTGASGNRTLAPGVTNETSNAKIVEILSGKDYAGDGLNFMVSDTLWSGPYMEFDSSDISGANFVDPWGNAFIIQEALDDNPATIPPSNNPYTLDINSWGPDETGGTSDDLKNF